MPEHTPDLTLSAADLQALLDLGDAPAIAAALRLVEIQLRAGGLPDDARAPERLGIRRRAWPDLRARLLEVFELRDGRWVHPGVADRLVAAARRRAARSQRAQRGWARRTTGETAAAARATGGGGTPRPPAAPATGGTTAGGAAPPPTAGPPPAAPEPPSIASSLFAHGRRLLESAGHPSRDAGRKLGYLRKQYGDTAVALAIERAETRAVSDPFPYIRKLAAELRRQQADAPGGSGAPERPRPVATPETMGLSPGLTARIRENARHDPGYVFSPKPPPQDRKARAES